MSADKVFYAVGFDKVKVLDPVGYMGAFVFGPEWDSPRHDEPNVGVVIAGESFVRVVRATSVVNDRSGMWGSVEKAFSENATVFIGAVT